MRATLGASINHTYDVGPHYLGVCAPGDLLPLAVVAGEGAVRVVSPRGQHQVGAARRGRGCGGGGCWGCCGVLLAVAIQTGVVPLTAFDIVIVATVFSGLYTSRSCWCWACWICAVVIRADSTITAA